ncbi:MAG: fructosamine kinase family protein [Cytophagaceae bacterium]
MDIDTLKKVFEDHLGKAVDIYSLHKLSGGCINEATCISTSAGEFVVKYNSIHKKAMFVCEQEGLEELSKASVFKVPEVIGVGETSYDSYILMEYIDSVPGKADFWSDFGQRLAMLHRASNSHYGFKKDNFIGSQSQHNNYNTDWIDFFVNLRLGVQVKRAVDSGWLSKTDVEAFDMLYVKLSDYLIVEPPSLLHGDLWSGNFMIGSDGRAVLIDPAVYYGNREVDIAFSKLFGGFREEFYKAYFEEFPVENGLNDRVELYNLYPLLVHVNLFGGSYVNSVRAILNRYS